MKTIYIIIMGLSLVIGLANSVPTSPSPEKEAETEETTKRVVHVGIGDMCSLGAAPVGPGGSWTVVEHNVEKVCAPGTSCRSGACNCDDLEDGTVMSLDSDVDGNRVCKRIAGQKCSNDGDCFRDVPCKEGVCTCDKSENKWCVDKKMDAIILA